MDGNHPGKDLMAGVAKVDITPERGVQVAGAVGAHRPAKYVADPIFARALVLTAGGEKLCIISADLTIITREYSDQVRDWAGKLGFERDAVMVHATQTHSAPGVGHFILSEEFDLPGEFDWVKGSDLEYSALAVERMKEAVELADGSLEPVQLGFGSGIEGRMAHNRRAVTRDGSVQMPGPRWVGPAGNTNILYMEGPIDPEVAVMCLRDDSLRFPAIVVNYACHPVHVFPRPIISPDWPGALCDEIVDLYGEGCTPVVINGPCGNVNPWPPFDPDYVEDHREMGRVLSKTVGTVVENIDFADVAKLDCASETLALPIRDIDPEDLERARERIGEEPVPAWIDEPYRGVRGDWVMAAGLVDLDNLRSKSPTYDYEIQVFRVGDVAIVGLPGEPFVEGGLRIKLNSPTRCTIVAHDVNHYAGYLPIGEAFERGGHETSTGNWSRFRPDALDTVVEKSTEMVRELFQDDGQDPRH